MVRSKLCVTLDLLALLLAGCADSSDNPVVPGPDAAVPERFRKFADAVEAERVSLGAPGMAVAVIERGEITFAYGFGKKDASQSDPVLPSTLFRIGACAQMLTAIGLLQTVDAGLVNLEDPVTKHIPGFHLNKTPEAAASIQVRHLLSHTSGLFDYGSNMAAAGEQGDAGLAEFMTGGLADVEYVSTPPGGVFAYAYVNYGLAGLVAEKVLATPFRTLMHDRVFAPLGMSRTYFLASEVLADGDYALGENCQNKQDPRCFATELSNVIRPDSYDSSWLRPAGMAWSSVVDLAQVARFLVHGQADVLSPGLWSAMTTAQVSTKEAADIVGYGFGVKILQGLANGSALPYRSIKVVLQAGDIVGFAGDILCLPALDFCVVSLANANGAHLSSSMLVAFDTLVQLPAPGGMPDVDPKPELYPRYAGAYDDVFGVGKLSIVHDRGKLTITIPSFDAAGTPYQAELQPLYLDNFLITVADRQRPLTFIADQSGTYKYVRWWPYVATRAP